VAGFRRLLPFAAGGLATGRPTPAERQQTPLSCRSLIFSERAHLLPLLSLTNYGCAALHRVAPVIMQQAFPLITTA